MSENKSETSNTKGSKLSGTHSSEVFRGGKPQNGIYFSVKPDINLAAQEEVVLQFWDDQKIFEKTMDSEKKTYSFYDGPPFATGLPHYGHLLAGVLKDVVPRYWTMKGYNVPRRFGWDCHGLPIENIVEKELGFKSKKDIEDFGIDKFNEVCRSKVLK
jgi:isoleucyl-tRNA synthetase